MIPDPGHFTGLAPADIWKLAMLGRYTVNAIAGSHIWVVQVAIVLDRPWPALSLDVSKIRNLLFARGNYHETLQARKSRYAPWYHSLSDSVPKEGHNNVADRLQWDGKKRKPCYR